MKFTLRQFIVASATALTGIALTACSTAQSTSTSSELCGETTVSMGELGPAAAPPATADRWASEDVYFLGAGDELGRQIFTRYVASLRASEQYYATGADDFPANE